MFSLVAVGYIWTRYAEISINKFGMRGPEIQLGPGEVVGDDHGGFWAGIGGKTQRRHRLFCA